MIEYKEKDTWNVSRIINDFSKAQEKFFSLPPAISIFGSARTPETNWYYKKTLEISQKLSDKGFSIVTGGGGGIMEAGNKGAKVSIGLKVKLPKEQKVNKFVEYALDFKYLFTRKMAFMKHSVGFIAMPGGFGTLDEISEALCLVQTKSRGVFPMVLFGKEFYEPLENFFKVMLEYEYIKKEDLKLYIITDDINEAVEFIEKHSNRNFANLEKKGL